MKKPNPPTTVPAKMLNEYVSEIEKNIEVLSAPVLRRLQGRLDEHLGKVESNELEALQAASREAIEATKKPMTALLKRLKTREITVTVTVKAKARLGVGAEFISDGANGASLNVYEPPFIFGDEIHKKIASAIEKAAAKDLQQFRVDTRETVNAVNAILKKRRMHAKDLQDEYRDLLDEE